MNVRDVLEGVAEEVRRRIRNGELTERRLARMTGISQPHVHNMLKGVRVLSPEMADRILRELHVDVVQLLCADSSKPGAGTPAVDYVRVFEGALGPGHPFPTSVGASEYPFPAEDLAHLTEPRLVRLAADPALGDALLAGDLALLDHDPGRLRDPDHNGLFAVDLGEHGLVRRVQHDGRRLLLTAPAAREGSENHWIPLTSRTILKVVKARVVWIGRKLEPLPLATTTGPLEKAGGED